MKGNSDNVRLPRVSNKCKNFTPPYPICLTTHCGQDFLCFFTKKFAFSNHFLTPKPIEIDGVEYCCSEQFYMYMKAMYFDYHSLAKEIMLTNDPSTIKRLGNADTMRQRQANGAELKCRDFDHDKWRKVKRNVMLTGLRAKFEQNVQLFNMLIETEEALLIEASQTDTFWGIYFFYFFFFYFVEFFRGFKHNPLFFLFLDFFCLGFLLVRNFLYFWCSGLCLCFVIERSKVQFHLVANFFGLFRD
ncbi:unnamed protein product [Meloidogyne enterolobii]|uniref:Uncharacterized protein n=2 Tax=Meloidogyne enterolobii TaxID=390850 RepID=A0ACB0XZA4_MELEN